MMVERARQVKVLCRVVEVVRLVEDIWTRVKLLGRLLGMDRIGRVLEVRVRSKQMEMDGARQMGPALPGQRSSSRRTRRFGKQR